MLRRTAERPGEARRNTEMNHYFLEDYLVALSGVRHMCFGDARRWLPNHFLPMPHVDWTRSVAVSCNC